MSRPSSPRTASPGLLAPGLVVTLPDEVRAYAFYNPADYTKEYISMLLRGDVYGLPFTNGTKRSCYARFVANNHPVLSIFLADEQHPFSRNERLLVNFCYFSWAFFVAGCFANAEGLAWWIVSFVITAVTLPYSMILKLLAECGCVQHSRSTCLKRCIEGFGTCCLFIFAILGVLYIALGVTLFIQVNGADKVSSWALSIGQSWCLWFVYWLPFFLLKFHRGRQAFQARFPQDCQAITPYTPDTAAAAVGAGPAISVVPMTPVINPAAAGAAFAFAPPVPPPAVLTVPGGGPVPPTIIVQPSTQPQQQSPPSESGPGLLTLSSPKSRRAASSPRGAASPLAPPSPPPPPLAPPVVAAVQSPPMVRAMQVVIPPGAQPGMPLTVMTPEGLAVTIVVQPEHGPGAAIIVAY